MSKRKCAAGLVLFFLCVSAASSQASQAAAPQSPYSKRVRLEPKFSGPVTIDLTGDTRQGFEKLAALAGIQAVFHPRFAPAAFPPNLTLNAVDFFAALDRLSRLSGGFWETYDRKTILVAPDDPAIRKQVETQALKTVSFPAGAGTPTAASLLAALRARMELKTAAVSTPQNAILLRDSAENVAMVEEILSTAAGSPGAARQAAAAAADSGTLLTDMAGNVHAPEAGLLRKTIAGSHRELQAVTPGPLTLRMQSPSRETFQMLADRAGIQVIFHRQFAQRVAEPFALDDVDIFTALDLLSFKTGNFWQVVDPHTIIVATDNPTVRRDVEPMVIKTVYFKNLTRQQEMTETVTALRALLGVNQIAMSTPQNAILLRDSADRIALAERIAAVFDRPSASVSGAPNQAPASAPIPSGVFAQPTDQEASRALFSQLQPASAAPISITMNQPSRQAFETLASRAGVQILFHRQFANGAAFQFAVTDADLATALNRLSFVTGNFWRVLDPHTIVVATDNPTVRRDVEPMVLKPIFLKNLIKQQEVTELVTALRTLLSFNQIAISTPQNIILLRDTAEKVALAEKIADVFDRPAPGNTAASNRTVAVPGIPSGVFAQPTDLDAIRIARTPLQLQTTGPVSIRMNQPSRTSFETLAQLAGIQVVFHRQFANQAAFAFVQEGADALTTLDRLAFVTGTFWQVHDAHTIIVATDNPTVRRGFEPMIVKTIYLRNITTEREATEIVTALRTILSFNQIGISASAGAIVLRDSAEKIALAQKIVDLFDPPGAVSFAVPVAAPISSGAFATPMDAAARRARLRSDLHLDSAGLVTASFTHPSRQAFETLADVNGFRVMFHPSFTDAAAFAFQVENVDLVEALDRLSFQTGNFWQPSSEKTILVAADTAMARKDVESAVTKTLALKNIQTTEGVTEVAAALRTVGALTQIESNENSMTLTDSVDKIALAERIVADLDIPGRMPLARTPRSAPPSQPAASPVAPNPLGPPQAPSLPRF